MRVIGFDVSSSTIGWGVLDLEGEKISVVDSGYYKPPKKKDCSISTRLTAVFDWTQQMCVKYGVDAVSIENIVMFMKAKSKAETTITLAVFNRTVALASNIYLKSINSSSEPYLYAVITIRSSIRKKAQLEELPKENVPQVIFDNLGQAFELEYKKTGKLKDENFDRADGIAVAWCHIIKVLDGSV